MQQNHSFAGYGFQSYPKTVPPPIPLIVGEGDVTAVTFADGSVQLYFVPAIRRTHSSCSCNVRNPCSGLGSCVTNTEVWFIRSFPRPNVNILSFPPGYFNSQLPNTFGECPPYSPPSYGFNNYSTTYPPAYHEYTQKFHNDTWTSTTDIHYFYPSLLQVKYFQYCSETQTDTPLQIISGQNGECNRPCNCSPSLSKKKKIKCECHPKLHIKSSESCMSVDNERSESEHLKKHTCVCKDIKDTSDKFVMTYDEQTTKDRRETQTEEIPRPSKPSDVKTATRKPRRNCNTPKTNLRIRSSSKSCSLCSGCSTSETER